MIVEQVSLRQYRSYRALELRLEPGIVLVTGPNGVGKTNLLESLHVTTQGFSPRTRNDTQLIQFGADAARTTAEGHSDTRRLSLSVTLHAAKGKEATLNGARLPSTESLRAEVSTLVFTPDRLTVVKGGPAARRAYFDRALTRMYRPRIGLPQAYLAALAQRNAALRRIQLGLSDRATIEPWTDQVATLGGELVHARAALLDALAPAFAGRADELGLPNARLAYDGEPPTHKSLTARLTRDIERGSTGDGPHLHDVVISSAERDLRHFGSQGEQRLAVLALLLAEAELLPTRPLLLLDDVLSELDVGRRRVLVDLLAGSGQTMITATHAGALPGEPAQLIEVEHGTAR